jgi:aspartyl-tRNA(Asn)/glutamyl-tRNA(Gln) amidotransferase subunit A
MSKQTISEILARYESGESAADVVGAALEQAGDNTYGAWLAMADRDRALERARQFDAARAHGEKVGPLAGVPFALKDNIVTRELPTTAASKILEGYTSPFDATVAARLEAAGAVLVGKTNLDEFAMGSSNEHSAYGPVRNPVDPERVPGGSSGGSAAAVAAGDVPFSLGSDTGGSIRQPAAHTGVVGLKPTYGRVSRWGLIAYASSLDQIGTFSHTVEDAARVLEIIAGPDEFDMTSADAPVASWADMCGEPIEGTKIGVPKEYFEAGEGGLDPDVSARVRDAIEALANAGAEIVEISLPHTEYAVATYYVIATAEAASNLARYDGVRYGVRGGESGDLAEMYEATRSSGFGDEVKRRILLGTFVLSAGYADQYYRRAQQVRTLIRQDFEAAFEKVDAIVSPTAPTPAFELGAKSTPLQMYLEDIYTIACNLAGIPGMSVPCGTTSAGLPVGLQLMTKAFDEATLFRVGAAYESLRGGDQ